MAKEKVLLKNELFNKETVTVLSNAIKNVYEPLNEELFINDVIGEFHNLELMDRIHWITETLTKHLPDSYIDSVNILYESLNKINHEGMFAFSSYPDFVSLNGCNKENLELSLYMLGEFTKLFSAEFSIRFFINEFPETTYLKMVEWSKSDNVHQRRLASEGLRPKLPWAKGITFDIYKGIKPLDNLFYDKERYVTRSVANHLNDISKIDPLLVLSTLSRWKVSGKQDIDEMKYIISHSLRTLVKKGHKETLEFLGFNCNPKIKVENLLIQNDHINIGESLSFSFYIEALKDEALVIDYVITYPKANNKTSKKVFKIKKVNMKKGMKIEIVKNHPFRVMTTKKLYDGEYEIDIQINGLEFSNAKFYITV